MQALDGEERVFIDREAVIKIAHHEGVDHFQLRQQQREQPQRVHCPQSVGGVRLQQGLFEIQPEFRALGRRGGERRKGLFDAILRGGAELQSVMRHEVK